MKFMGSILPKRDCPSIDKARWVALIQEIASLAPPEDFNPISKSWEARPGADWAYVKVSGCVAGAMKWAQDANEIHVSGDDEAVGAIAREVAALWAADTIETNFLSHSEYSRLIEPIFESISIYDGPDVFRKQFRTLRPEVGHLLAAHWCQSEVCNGGFHQFFYNPTGVLAPEALAAFRAIGLHEWAELLEQAMLFFGRRYPRDERKRRKRLDSVPIAEDGEGNPFNELDDRFFEWLHAETGRFRKGSERIRKFNRTLTALVQALVRDVVESMNQSWRGYRPAIRRGKATGRN